MSLDSKALALAAAVGTDIKQMILAYGELNTLTTSQKDNLVNAINSVKAQADAVDLTVIIDDLNVAINKTWSSNKIVAALEVLKHEIINDAPEQYNTLKEIANYISANAQSTADLLAAIGNLVRYDELQVRTEAEQLQARANIDISDNTGIEFGIKYVEAKSPGNDYVEADVIDDDYVV